MTTIVSCSQLPYILLKPLKLHLSLLQNRSVDTRKLITEYNVHVFTHSRATVKIFAITTANNMIISIKIIVIKW